MSIETISEKIPQELYGISRSIHMVGGKPVLVGGFVRDIIMDLDSKDIDIEVFNIESDTLASVLRMFGKVSEVGKSFGVIKLTTKEYEYDFSLPRTEIKIGDGHKGFDVKPNSSMTFEEAASRRDFTINAIGYDLVDKEVLDPFNGIGDIEKNILRHVGPAFSEDPLRVLRAMQFAARFQMKIHSGTISLCSSIDLQSLPKERVWEELKKMLLKSSRPSIGFHYMKPLGIDKLDPFSQLFELQVQSKYDEGTAWAHMIRSVDVAAQYKVGDEVKDITLMLGVMLYDVLMPSFILIGFTNQSDINEGVENLLRHKSKIGQAFTRQVTIKPAAIRRLSLDTDVDLLDKIERAYFFGSAATRDAKITEYSQGDWFKKKVEEVWKNQQRKPILSGKHLLDSNMRPGPKCGELLRKAFNAQLNDEFNNLSGAKAWLSMEIMRNPEWIM